jgi:ferrous iron transport protein A
MSETSIPQFLDRLGAKKPARVVRVNPLEGANPLARQLEEIGFIPGERVQVLSKALFGGDPMVVRVGVSTFALRKAEAQLIEIVPER